MSEATELITASDEVLARAVDALAGAEERPGQGTLAAAVATAIATRRHLLAEAPTGSGKSLAYLAPAVASGLRVVVATATLALQDQLWRKDIPHVREHGGVPFTAALLKGRSQYLCRARLAVAGEGDALFDERPGPNFAVDLAHLQRWAGETATGDVGELDADIGRVSIRAVTVGAQECPGAAKCTFGGDCFAERARAAAMEAGVLVVNHALYCAHLASGGHVLPPHDLVVFDEAHALADVATDALGLDLAPLGVRQLAARLAAGGAPRRATDGVATAADALDRALNAESGRVDPREGELADALAAAAEHTASALAGIDRARDATLVAQVSQLATARLEALRRLRDPEPGDVVWVDGARPVLHLAPVAVGPTLAARLFSRTPAVLLSATLGGGERFAPLARRLGLDPDATDSGAAGSDATGANEEAGGGEHDDDDDRSRGLAYDALTVASPFDFRSQALLYVPRHLPDRRDASWFDAAAEEVRALVDAAGGRALVLCTSRAEVARLATMLRDRTDHVVLAQDDAPKARLVDRFTAEEHSCLVATRSFWVGLDVPGPACVLVVIDRLPFSRPDDPLEQARREAAERAGGSGFADVDLPRAALVLAQGAGRLVRSRTDRGVVAVLDRRLATAGYRAALLDALPPMRRVVDPEVAREFLADVAAAR